MYILTWQQRGYIKDYICTMIAEEWKKTRPESGPSFDSISDCNCEDHTRRRELAKSKWHYNQVNALLESWAGMPTEQVQRLGQAALLNKGSFGPFFNEEQYWAEIMVAIYRVTQAELKARNIKYVKLYRGCNKLYSLRPISSFSSSLDIVKTTFAKYDNVGKLEPIYYGSIPAQYIVSTFFTGYGCAYEQEYVVAGFGNVMRHLKTMDA